MDLFVLKKIKEGDIKAFESIFRLYYTPLCLYATSITGEQEVAEEIVQDLFYVFWKERESLPILRSIKNYLYGATRNRSLQYLEHREVRYRYRNTVLAGENPESESYTPQDQLEYKELQSLVNRALGKLPERRLRIFRMHRFEGMKYAEIASSLSLSIKTVEAEMTKALQTLRKKSRIIPNSYESNRKNKSKTDQAWAQLYTRLEQDGLLDKPISGTQIPYRIGLMKWAAAIIILCVSVATAIFLGQERTPETTLLTLHNNEASTTLVTTLEDGSIVYLADNSQLSYPEHFQREKREVSLLGNALFDVSGNKERPFLIETEQARIEVLGTSFNIKSSDKSAFELAVRRGLVKVTLKKNGEQTLVKAGQTVSLFSNRLQVAPTQDNEQFSDYTRRIQFKDERLGDILHVINLEYPMMPLKTTADLENRRLTVSFYNNSPATMAELICAALKLKCTQQNNIWMISEP